MTLQELASYICEKAGKSDPVTLGICKDFLRVRYRMIYDAHLWRETLGLYSGPAPGAEVILPPQAGRVVAVRWNDRELLPADQGALFQVDATVFERLGIPAQFAILTPVATASMPTGNALSLVSSSGADIGPVLLRGELGGLPLEESVVLNGTTPVTAANTYDVLFTIAKGATAGSLTVRESASVLAVIPPAEAERKYQRIRLYEQPRDTGGAILILYKRKMPPFIQDVDTPMLGGIDNALIAFTLADLLERMRQYAKAQLKVQEGQAQLETAISLEKEQQGAVSRIIPAVDQSYELLLDQFTPTKGYY